MLKPVSKQSLNEDSIKLNCIKFRIEYNTNVAKMLKLVKGLKLTSKHAIIF